MQLHARNGSVEMNGSPVGPRCSPGPPEGPRLHTLPQTAVGQGLPGGQGEGVLGGVPGGLPGGLPDDEA